MGERPVPQGLHRLYPDPDRVELTGLYLGEELRSLAGRDETFIYANFVTSLDGRIALAHGDAHALAVPDATANPRDWRLLLELAAPADALIVSGRYLRELRAGNAQAPPPLEGPVPDDIVACRERLGLPAQPALVVVSNALDFTDEAIRRSERREVIVVSSARAEADALDRLRDAGVATAIAGTERVDGRALERALAERGLRLVYSIAGPRILHTLLEARVLRRLYLTTVLRVLGGEAYATLAEGDRLDPPFDLELTALYLDERGTEDVPQLLQVFDRLASDVRRPT